MSRELGPRAVARLLEVAAPLAAEPALGATSGERYELGAVIGRGGMGVVYEAWDKELGRQVALKVLTRAAGHSSGARARFVREAKAAARLQHPHIACVYDATANAIAMQRVKGETLPQLALDDPRQVATLVRDAALAIQYAHEEGIVHRDLSPSNLMVEPGARPHVYVMDFGLAKELAVDSSLSISGHVIGTPAYMAPEQARGGGDAVGPRTDVYGLGATLYAVLAGRAPFEEQDVYQLLRRVVDEEPRPLRELAPRVDRDLATIVAKCMEKEPQRRYASALALASDLDRWLRGEPIQARPASVVYRLGRFASRRQGAILASVSAAVLALLIAAPFLLQARARRSAAEQGHALTERTFVLSRRVHDALGAAREIRAAGAGREQTAFRVLESAIEECRSFLAENDSGHARLLLGQLLRAQGRDDEALAVLATADVGDSARAELALERGLALAALYSEGVPLLGETPPPELEAWRARGAADLGVALGASAEARSPERIFAAGQLAWLEGELERAIAHHREVVEMDVGHQDAHLALSRLYLLTERDDLGMRHSVIATDLLRGNRPVYVAARMQLGEAAPAEPARELLPLEGMRELLVDFNLVLQLEPGELASRGLRAQVQARRALRAVARGARFEARTGLELAARELGAALELDGENAAARVNRGACRAQLARVLADAGETSAAAAALDGALADYDAAILIEPGLAVAWFDRALLHHYRARIAQLALRAGDARRELERARNDALAALERVGEDHPFRWRIEALAAELE